MVFAFGEGLQERVEWRLAHIRMSLGCWRAKGSQKMIPDAMLDGLSKYLKVISEGSRQCVSALAGLAFRFS